MVCVKNEESVKGFRQQRVHLVRLGHESKVESKEVVHERLGVVGVQERLPDGLLVRVCRDDRKFGEQSNRREFNLFVIVHVERIAVVRAECTHRTRQHAHRVGIVR